MGRKRYLKLGLFIAFVLIGIGYLYLFFQKGIYYEDSFLRKSKKQDEIVYVGNVAGDLIKISVEGNMESNKEARVHYMVADRLDVTYQVKEQYNDKENRREVLIYSGDLLIFRGAYNGPDVIFEIGDDGQYILFPSQSDFIINSNKPGLFQISDINTISFAYQGNVRIRGNIVWLMMAILLLIFTGIDRKWPMFFFTWKHFLSVNNPEPSDLYLLIQKINWVVVPIIAGVLMIMGLMNVVG